MTGFLAVDIDEDLRIEEALANEYIQTFGGMIYTSVSHTDENHRFRIVFELEKPITDRHVLEHALTGLIRKLGGDPACKDACRVFFGNTEAQITHIGKLLPATMVDELVLRGQEIELASSTTRRSKGEPATVHSRQQIDPELQVQDPNGQWHRLADLPPKTPILCPMHVDRKSSAFTLESRTGVLGIHCMKCQATYFVSSSDPAYDFDYGLKPLRNFPEDFYEIACDDPVFGGEIVETLPASVRFFNERYLSQVETLADLVFVKSPKNTGKTELLKDIVKEAKDSRRPVLLIGHRQSLITSTAARLGLTSYITILEDAGSGRSEVKPKPVTELYAICLDSLETRLTPLLHKFDTVIIDEVEQVLAHLTSDTIRPRRRESLIYLQHYLQQATKVYLLDADLNKPTIHCVGALVGKRTDKECLVVVNDWVEQRGTTFLYPSPIHLLHVLSEHLEAGKRCFVCSNSKNFVMATMLALQERHPEKSFYSVTSDNSQTQAAQEFLRFLPNSLLQYDCVLVSPAVGTGVDITFPGGQTGVDAVFGFFRDQINTHFDIDQQLCRVRHPGSVHVLVADGEYRFETDRDVIRRELMSSRHDGPMLIGLSSDGRPQYSAIDELYAEIYSEIASLQRASKNQLRRNFVELRKLNGWQVDEVPLDDTAWQSGIKIARSGKELSDNERIRIICSAPEITNGIYTELKKRSEHGTLLAPEVAAMKRFEIEKFYCTNVTPELVKLDSDGRYRSCVRNFELIHETEENAARFCRNNSDLLAVDRRESVDRRRLLLDLYASAGVFTSSYGFDRAAIITHDRLVPFIETCRRNEVSIQRLLRIELRKDLREKPVRQLGELLGLVGLKQAKAGTQKVGDNKIYLYKISPASLDAMQEIGSRRQDEVTSDGWRVTRDDDNSGDLVRRYDETIARAIKEWKVRPHTVKAVPPSLQSKLVDSIFGE